VTQYETTPEAWGALIETEKRARRLFAESSLSRVPDEAPNRLRGETLRTIAAPIVERQSDIDP
jgi:hypothetical protein